MCSDCEAHGLKEHGMAVEILHTSARESWPEGRPHGINKLFKIGCLRCTC